MSKGKIILISGAARSGKSSFAEQLARDLDERVAYLATAQGLDDEMQDRIARHRENRPAVWRTFEEPFELGEVIRGNHQEYRTWLLDCITLYVSNLLFAKVQHVTTDNYIATAVQDHILGKIDHLIETVEETGITLVAVTNEVGWGIVPADPLSRAYRDIAGIVNRKLADRANEVYLVALGFPLRLKPSSQQRVDHA